MQEKTPKKRKRASAHCRKPPFFKQNKHHVKQAKKQEKTLRQYTTNENKPKIKKVISRALKKRVVNERKLPKTRKRHKQEPAKNKKGTNMSYLPKKNKQAFRKNITKNKASRELHI